MVPLAHTENIVWLGVKPFKIYLFFFLKEGKGRGKKKKRKRNQQWAPLAPRPLGTSQLPHNFYFIFDRRKGKKYTKNAGAAADRQPAVGPHFSPFFFWPNTPLPMTVWLFEKIKHVSKNKPTIQEIISLIKKKMNVLKSCRSLVMVTMTLSWGLESE